ncbi:ABC transporter-like protein 12 [Leptotrombidium deliense]|uniref:ABC transporter-like protein 12 n=1 Tax=Leptotrombidium deliense TaxID=299467 RepID=A0A443SBX9_9ACAR|nr:ABC transporter-like protein 12 [Leptotrombidium deliense]
MGGDNRVRSVDIKNEQIKEDANERSAGYTVTWNNLSYTVSNNIFQRLLAMIQGIKVSKKKLIVKNVSGCFNSGELVAMMGPSGAGKSTLLDALVGRKVLGREGTVLCNRGSNLTLAFIPQTDAFFQVLTVREVIMFAAKLKLATKLLEEKNDWASRVRVGNSSGAKLKSRKYIPQLTEELLKQFGLEKCADNRISVCSGGQLKRLSVAQEMVVRPDILVLDEPTSGLDSTSCQQLILYLRQLTEEAQPTTVIATIHQPSYRVFTLFHRLYVLSSEGKCIYEGEPTAVVEYLSKFGLNCPAFYNPAEYIMEVACADFGTEVMDALSNAHDINFQQSLQNLNSPGVDLNELTKPKKYPKLSHFWTLTKRSFLITARDPWLFGLRLVMYTLTAVYVGFLYGTEIGKKGGCPPDIDADFDPKELEDIQRHTKVEVDTVVDNTGNIYFSLMFILFTSMMATVLVFPLEMQAFVKEKNNGWYGVGNYFLGKTMADVPFQIGFTTFYVVVTYIMNNQIPEFGRLIAYLTVLILTGLIAQSQGLLIGAFTMTNVTAGVYISPITAIPMLLYSGFFFKLSAMPIYHYVLMLTTYLKFSFSASLNAIYGFRRCGVEAEVTIVAARESLVDWFSSMLGVVSEQEMKESNNTITSTGVTSKFVDSIVKLIAGDYISDDGIVASLVLIYFEVEKSIFWVDLFVLIFWLIFMRTLAYLVIRWKVNKKQ